MSMDYPDYLRIRERSRALGRMWVIGDRGYYIGIFGAAITVSLVGATVVVRGIMTLGGFGSPAEREHMARIWHLVPYGLVSIPIFVVIFFTSAYLKGVAHRRSGIHDAPKADAQPNSRE